MADSSTNLKKVKKALMEVKKSVVGKDEEICKVMIAFLAGGHVLIEDIPGRNSCGIFVHRVLSLG